jgi:hypothetical protein
MAGETSNWEMLSRTLGLLKKRSNWILDRESVIYAAATVELV